MDETTAVGCGMPLVEILPALLTRAFPEIFVHI